MCDYPIVPLALLTLLGAITRGAADERPQLTLTLTASQSAILLAEPVLLVGALKNTGKQPVKEYRADRPHHAEAVDIFTSRDGVEFEEYRMGIYPTGKVERSLETLHPDEAWTFELRVLYTYKRPSRLAFERAGKYYIKVDYPLISASGRHRQVVQSNVVCVEIKAPEGMDAKLWEEISKPHFVYFLQCGLVKEGHAQVVPRAVQLLRAFPKSGYHDAIKWALQEFYRERISTIGQFTAQKEPELEKIREVLGIPKVPDGPFLEDQGTVLIPGVPIPDSGAIPRPAGKKRG
jgi:hypothetical protein